MPSRVANLSTSTQPLWIVTIFSILSAAQFSIPISSIFITFEGYQFDAYNFDKIFIPGKKPCAARKI
jgi:hypothetical protein